MVMWDMPKKGSGKRNEGKGNKKGKPLMCPRGDACTVPYCTFIHADTPRGVLGPRTETLSLAGAHGTPLPRILTGLEQQNDQLPHNPELRLEQPTSDAESS